MAKTKTRDSFTQTMLERADSAFSFDSEQRRRVVDDMRFAFVSGNQWDDHLTKKRRNRPCYEFNRTRQMVRRVTGQQLKNKPQIKVRATEEGDVATADVYNGLIKNIEVQSAAENAYDTAFQWSCGGGYGVLRVVSEYESDNSFDQCLKIKCVDDPMRVWCDPAAKEFDRSDATFWFIDSWMPLKAFKQRWPDADPVDFDAPGVRDRLEADWANADGVRIAEYWYKEQEKRLLYQLSDGTVVDAKEFDPIRDEAEAAGLTVKNEREVVKDCIYSVMVNGRGKLEEPQKWGGSMFPIIPQWGDLITLEGRQIYSGMIRFARDSQTIHNFELSTLVEVVAKMPNSPLTATTKMVEGLESYYERMGYDDAPVLIYNVDPLAPNARPTREAPATFPAAFANLSAIATEELKATTGVFDASLGARSNESSGRAILARQNEGEIANFVYIDNQIKALKRLGEVLVDAIPHYYDAERSIRILGEDGAEQYVQINRPTLDQQTGQVYIINDLSRGKYDVTVTVGKNFDTARMELAEVAQALAATPGPVGMIGQWLLLNSMDVPGMDEAVKALRKFMVAQGVLEPDDDTPAPQPQPDPGALAQAEKDKASAANQAAQARKNSAQAEGQEIENAAAVQMLGIGPPPQMPMGGGQPLSVRSPSLPPENAIPLPPPNGGFPPGFPG